MRKRDEVREREEERESEREEGEIRQRVDWQRRGVRGRGETEKERRRQTACES